MFPLYVSFVCACAHTPTLSNVCFHYALQRQSCSPPCTYVCMHYYSNQWTPMSKFVFWVVCANVGVMFEHSYYTCECIIIICTNGMGVRCSLLATALFFLHRPNTFICETEPSDIAAHIALPFVWMNIHMYIVMVDCRIRYCWCTHKWTVLFYFTQQHSLLQYSSPMTVDWWCIFV